MIAMTACSSLETETESVIGLTQDQLAEREAAIAERELAIASRESQLLRQSQEQQAALAAGASLGGMQEPLLPPGASAGECYARVWVPATYETEQVTIKTKDESEIITPIPAEYRWVEKTVTVSEPSTRLEVIPAVYGTESETVKVKEERNIWLTDLNRNSAPASEKLLASAAAGGIDLDAAKPGTCYHEHFKPAQYETVSDTVLTSEASQSFTTLPAQYETVEERILVSEASTQIIEVPAVYEMSSETIVDVPAHTIWKKGTGPIQRIDEATGEIMCLVEVPATYKTIQKRVLKTPATTKTVEIPAKYETVKVRRQVAEPKVVAKEIPATFSEVKRAELVADAEFVWHEVHDNTMTKETRTGAKICLINEPAQFKTVSRKTVITPASTRTVEIPAQFKTVRVKELVKPASEKRTVVPASFKTVTTRKIAKEGTMEWRSILCETNMTASRISKIQTALKEKGFNPGPIDGIIGSQTIAAVNEFQRENKLPVDRYLNIKTLNALGVSPK